MARNEKTATRWGVLLGALLALVLVGTLQARAEQTEEFHQTYKLSPNGTIRLQNVNGGVKISGWDRDDVQVDAVKTGRDKQSLDEAKIEVNASSGSIDVRTQYPSGGNEHHPAKVEYTLHVPRNAHLGEIATVNGNVFVQGVNGKVRVSSVNGDAVAQDLTSDVKLSSVNGHVRAVMAKVPAAQNINMDCVNGAVELTLPSDADVELSASTMHGAINNDFNVPVKKGFVGSNLQAKLGTGATHARLNTVNGSIRIQHASDGKPLSKVTNLLPEDRHFD